MKPQSFFAGRKKMNNTNELIKQCDLAFDFVQNLYMEVSYFIKEVDGLLLEEDFIIGRPSGYQINSRSSLGLEPQNVNMWLMRRMAVFFAPKDSFKSKGSRTSLDISKSAKVIYLRILLNGKNLNQPKIYAGVLYDIIGNPKSKYVKKFEQAMQYIEYNDDKIFKGNLKQIKHKDGNISFNGHLNSLNLFEINDSETIQKKIVEPCLKLYKQY